MKNKKTGKKQPIYAGWYCSYGDMQIMMASQADIDKHMATHNKYLKEKKEFEENCSLFVKDGGWCNNYGVDTTLVWKFIVKILDRQKKELSVRKFWELSLERGLTLKMKIK